MIILNNYISAITNSYIPSLTAYKTLTAITRIESHGKYAVYTVNPRKEAGGRSQLC